jgi:alpha-tubulin suppressor-like RCC1 family protein
VGDGIVTQTPPLPAAATSATVAPLYYAEPHVLDASRRWISLATSYATTCGIDSTNALFCWGFSKYGQAGNGSSTPAPIMYAQAVAIPAPNSETWVSVAPGNAHTCATTAANNVYCWGRRNVGQAGVGSTGTDLQTPTIVNRATPQGFTSIYTDTTHSCALLGSSAFCWGQNSSGGVGTGVLTPTSVTSPTAVTGSQSFSGLTLGSNFACGLVAVPSTAPQAYNAWCWGNSNKGILLNDAPGVTPPTPNPTPTPTLMNTSRQWELLDLGATHICGVDHADGKLYCWGDNGIENSTGQGKVGSVPASQTGNVGLVGAVRAATVKHTTP